MDLVRPLGLAGVRCAVVAPRLDPRRVSRLASAGVDPLDPARDGPALVERLMDFGRGQAEPPVLFFQSDPELLLVSRHRERLAEAFRFTIAKPELVETLTDKARFQPLAERLELPIPRSVCRNPGDPATRSQHLSYPLIVKPITRDHDRWAPIDRLRKAVRADSPAELDDLRRRLDAGGIHAVMQELIPGPESMIESYHAYIDPSGNLAGEYTGKKIRTRPAEFGYTTALTITDVPEVRDLGREIVGRLGLTGVVKIDFKRRPDDTLGLLEVNPRFNLWHHPGALAGINLPAMVYADLTGGRRLASTSVRPGVTWSDPPGDAAAAREAGVPLRAWLRFMRRCEAKAYFAWDDPACAVARLISVLGGAAVRRLLRLAGR